MTGGVTRVRPEGRQPGRDDTGTSPRDEHRPGPGDDMGTFTGVASATRIAAPPGADPGTLAGP